MKKKKITLADVASLAKVSVATVSRISNGTAGASPEVEKRVKNAAAKLGIDLHRQNKAGMVAFLLSNRERLHPFHSRVLVGAEEYCAQQGCDLLFLSFRYSLTASLRELHLPRITERRHAVSGYIVGGTNSKSLLELLTHKRIPFVVLGNNIVGEWKPQEHDVVWTDDSQGAYDATRYLLSLGHRAIWFIGNCRLPWFSRTAAGYSRAISEVSLSPQIEDVNSGKTEEVGYLAAKLILGRGDGVSAVLAGDARAAYGAYHALKDVGLRIPDDVSVAGIGEAEATMLDPPLTTVSEFPEQVGRELARLLLNRLAKPDLAPQQVVVPTQLVKRESCGRVSVADAFAVNVYAEQQSSSNEP